MPDLTDREAREKELTAALLLMLGEYEGDPSAVNWSGFQMDLANALRPKLLDTYLKGYQQIIQGLGLDPDAFPMQGDAGQWADKYSQELARAMTENTQARVSDDPETLADQLGESRATNVSITETTRALTAGEYGAMAGAVSLGFIAPDDVDVMWHTAEDDAVCDECARLGDPSRADWQVECPEGPPLHPRCRCYLDYTASGSMLTSMEAWTDEAREKSLLTRQANAIMAPDTGGQFGGSIRDLEPDEVPDYQYRRNGSMVASFKLGTKEYVVNIGRRDDPEIGRGYELAFSRNDDKGRTSFGLTGDTGSQAIAVFRRVGAVLDNFLKNQEPGALWFTADKGDKGREELYHKFAKVIVARYPEYNLRVMPDPHMPDSVVLFKFTRKDGIGTTESLQETYAETFDRIFGLTSLEAWTDEAREKSLLTRQANAKTAAPVNRVEDWAQGRDTVPISESGIPGPPEDGLFGALSPEYDGPDFSRAPVVSMPIDQLVSYGDVDEVSVKGVKGYLNQDQPIQPVNVVSYQGHNYLMDGHHRTVASILRGEKSVPARVVRVKRISPSGKPVLEAWTDEAREKSLATRQANAAMKMDEGRQFSVGGSDEPDESTRSAEQRLADLPEAPDGYRHWDRLEPGTDKVIDGGSQVRMKDLGFAGPGTMYSGRNTDKEAKIAVKMTLDPSQIHYTQSSVHHNAVARKLTGNDPKAEDFGATGLPVVVKEGDEYHLQDGHHRASADVLRTGKVTALVVEYVPGKKGYAYKKPTLPADDKQFSVGGSRATDPDQDWSEVMQVALPMDRQDRVAYRTDAAHSSYKGKAVFGKGLYVGLNRDEVAEMTLDPEGEVDAKPNEASITEIQLPKSLKLIELDSANLPGGKRPWDGERLKAAVLQGGYDGIRIKADSLNYGGDQVVIYRGMDEIKQMAAASTKTGRGKTWDTAGEMAKEIRDRVAQSGMKTQVQFEVSLGKKTMGSYKGTVIGYFNKQSQGIVFSVSALKKMPKNRALGYVDHEVSHAQMHKFSRTPEGRKWLKANITRLADDDGTTSYSKAWWKEATKAWDMDRDLGGKDPYDFYLFAADESLAEMRRTGKMKGAYQDLAARIDKKYPGRSIESEIIGADDAGSGVIRDHAGNYILLVDEDFNPVSEEDAVAARVWGVDGSAAWVAIDAAWAGLDV